MRGYYNNTEPTMLEKLICVATYLTGGTVGFVWIVFCHITKNYPKTFVKFHAFQSILISIILWLFNTLMAIILAFVKIIPFIGMLIINIYYYIFQAPIILGYFSLFHSAMLLLIFYLCINAFMGKYSEIPFISDNVKKMI